MSDKFLGSLYLFTNALERDFSSLELCDREHNNKDLRASLSSLLLTTYFKQNNNNALRIDRESLSLAWIMFKVGTLVETQ
jgi:hypothetical protein